MDQNSNNLEILITADLNRGLSINKINNAIKAVEKHQSLRDLNLKFNIDKSVANSFSELNRNLQQTANHLSQLRSAEQGAAQAINRNTSNVNKETEAYNKQTKELQKNEEIRRRITSNQDGSVRTSTTTGSKFNNVTNTQTIKQTDSGAPEIISHPAVQVINTKALEDAQKSLSNFASEGSSRLQELSKHFGDTDKRVQDLKNRLSTLSVDSSKTEYDTVTKKLSQLENIQKSQLGDLRKGEAEALKLANQIADGKMKAQNEFASLQAKQQQEAVKNSQAEANLINKQFDQYKSYQRNKELIEAQAHKENLRRNTILGDARITDQKTASILAERENREYNKRILEQTKNYSDWWNKALNQRESQEARKAIVAQNREDKNTKSYSDFWGKALIDRDQKEQRFYDSQTQRLTKNKFDASSLLDDKRSNYLIGQYDNVIQKMNQMQASGKVLTQSDVNGINKRIERLDNYRKIQTQIEQRTKSLNSIIASSEKTAGTFSAKFGTEKYDQSGIDPLLRQLRELSPVSKDAVVQANNIKNKISQIGAEANAASGKALTFGKALSTAMVNILPPIEVTL